MAIFLTTRGTTSEIEKIINNSTNGIVLISPYIKISGSLFQNLKAADQKGKTITLIYGKENLKSNTFKQLNQLKNVKIYYLKNLHAKCYFNESSMIITSLNLYDFSEIDNREMGVLLTKQDDKEVFIEAIKEAKIIISLATRIDSNIQVKKIQQKQTIVKPNVEKQETKSIWFKDLSDILPSIFGSKGYCIGCKVRMEYDEYKPYCPDCYKSWIKNKRQKAKFCHRCGSSSLTSINRPLCRSCFDKL